MVYKRIIQKDILYPELSYLIVGIAFDVFNKLGPGYGEKYYHRAMAEIFKPMGILFKQEVRVVVELGKDKKLICFLDFVVDNKIILEIKKGDRFSKNNIDQLYGYLRATGLQLGILINFTKSGVQFRRILNIRN